jgi:hypothetical protein
VVGWFGHQLVTYNPGVNIAGTPHRGTPPQLNRTPCPQHNRALTARNATGFLARNIQCYTQCYRSILPAVRPDNTAVDIRRARPRTALDGFSGSPRAPSASTATGYSAPKQRPRYARRSSATGELITRLPLLARTARDLIAPTRCRTRPPRLTLSATESTQQPQPPLLPQYPSGPFQGPTYPEGVVCQMCGIYMSTSCLNILFECRVRGRLRNLN